MGLPIPPRTGRRSKLVQPFLSLEQGDTRHGGYLRRIDLVATRNKRARVFPWLSNRLEGSIHHLLRQGDSKHQATSNTRRNMALQGHIEYLRGVLKRTEDERDNAWRENGDAHREKDKARQEKDAACRERDQARKEKADANAERDKLREQLKTVNTELATMKAERAPLLEQLQTVNGELATTKVERAQLQEQLNVSQGRGGGNGGEGSGGQAMMTQQLYLRQRQLDTVQSDETRRHRVERCVQYAGLAKADMLFWETMIETESRLEGLITARDMELVLQMFTDIACLVEKERIVRSRRQTDEESVDYESVAGLLTPMSGSTLE